MSRPFRLFAYGTLKQNGGHYASLCREARLLGPGLVRGRVVERPEGYPVLFVPPDTILAFATDAAGAASCSDTTAQASVPDPDTFLQPPSPPSPWTLVRGDILLFDSETPHLARLDAFEDFFINRPSMYERVLLPVWSQGTLLPCWTYISPHSIRFSKEFSR